MSMGMVAGAVAVGGTILGNRNQKKAAEMQANSARDANQLQLDMFNKIQDIEVLYPLSIYFFICINLLCCFPAIQLAALLIKKNNLEAVEDE